MTAVIGVSERSRRADGSYLVRVSFPDSAEHEVVVADPAVDGDEDRLAWYFEEHLRFPFLDQDWDDDAVRRLRAYGQRLFEQVFGGAAAGGYRALAQRGFDGCRLEVRGTAAFHRLHWEALFDPQLPVPAVLRLPVTRRVDLAPPGFELPPERSTLNILVVTARPAGRADVGYRTISRPLLDGLRTADRPVVVDLVRPGTWQAVERQLRAATKRHGSGYYQVIHFDAHGAVAGFAELEAGRAAERYLFGSGHPAAFEGERAFLFFETAADGKSEPVSAQQVADLLAEHRVPVAVLNACQSAKEPASEASLAQRLVAAGVPVTVGMAYSVTVSAAEKAMPLLYTGLARGDDPVTAMQTARRSLFDDKARRAYFDQSLNLEDWVLPVVFAQREVRLQLTEMSLEQQARYFEREALVGDEPGTEYGFVGRDLDIQAIERRLLVREDRNMLLVKGMAGAGKSTLLEHLGWWWQRTGLVEMVFRFSYEDRAWTLDQMIHDIAAALLDRVEQAKLEMLPAAAQPERLAQLLRARRYLLILDNTESITATPAAIPHALPEPERERLATFLARLRGGRTLVLFGSREDEEWIGPRTFADNLYPLPGLDDQAASTLIEAILTRHGGTRHFTDADQRKALDELTTLLGGYPLPLTVVLPALRTHTPAEILAELRQGDGDVEPIGSVGRAIEYSHGKLDPATQNSLLLLAPFTASIPTFALDECRQYLAGHEAVGRLGAIDLRAAVAEVVRVGLAAPQAQLSDWVQILPVLPYFLRNRIHQHPALQELAQQAHYLLYVSLGRQIRLMLTSTDPQERAVGHLAARTEYANLTTALDHGLRTMQPITQIMSALEEYLDQTNQQESRRRLLDTAIAADRGSGRDDLRRELAQLHNLAGRAAQDSRRFEQAEAHYLQAIDIHLEFDDRRSLANLYGQLGIAARLQRRFEEAEARNRQALELLTEFNDRRSAATGYHQLGVAKQDQGQFEEAEAHYRQALELLAEFNDRHGSARVYHQLGIAKQEQKQFEEAEAHFRQALQLLTEFNDRHGAARVYGQLGIAKQEQEQLGEAEAHYRQALKLFLEFDDRHSAAAVYYQLGGVAYEQRRLDQAAAHYRQALDIDLTFDDRFRAASSYRRLGKIAQERQRGDEAALAFAKAAAIWHELHDVWPADALTALSGVRQALDPDEFLRILQAELGPEPAAAINAAIDAAIDERGE
ncbi:tetratricopeptide repeat protein [Actinoplanes sp. NPDC049668]|uniref:tetratricopeptide repeat protein n=1 Tax=unclassified Actinoplanes TaxID=2626549 RepID=UPI0033B5E9FF